jgi:predicted RNA-binding Zn-ribbon protein involved in translation (DUF1610 family)
MPLPIQPVSFACAGCGWKKTVAPRSDMLFPGLNWHTQCPRCGHEPLDRRLASELDKLYLMLVRVFGRNKI